MTRPALSWDDVHLVLALGRGRSITAGARALGMDQSTASRRLAALEEAVGTRLFDRVSSGLEPTPLAARVLALAEAAEEHIDALARVMAGADVTLRGTVRVAVPDAIDSYLVVPALPEFRKRCPEVVVELIASAQLANLARREADLALRFVRPSSGGLVIRKVARLEDGVFATAELARQAGRGAPVPWIAWDEGIASPDEARWMATHVPPDRVVLRTNRIEAMMAAAVAGLGLALMPAVLARQERRLHAVTMATGEAMPGADLWLVGHRGVIDVPRVRALWDFLEDLAVRSLA